MTPAHDEVARRTVPCAGRRAHIFWISLTPRAPLASAEWSRSGGSKAISPPAMLMGGDPASSGADVVVVVVVVVVAAGAVAVAVRCR